MSGYYPAQICLNGHVISDYQNNVEKYCSDCGAETITNCPSCGNPIRGSYNDEYVIVATKYKLPSYCYNCGSPYPWTQSKIEAIQELIDFDKELSQDKKTFIKDNINSLTADTPKTKVVATKFKFYLSEATNSIGNAIRDILIDVISESAKKIIFPQ